MGPYYLLPLLLWCVGASRGTPNCEKSLGAPLIVAHRYVLGAPQGPLAWNSLDCKHLRDPCLALDHRCLFVLAQLLVSVGKIEDGAGAAGLLNEGGGGEF